MRIPELVAHRGAPLHAPENTLPAVEAALEAGARYLEIDVQTSADHVPVLFHDATLARLCGVDGRIRDASLAELSALRASHPARFGSAFSGVPIPTLSAVVNLLEAWPGVTLFVEIKDEAIAHSGIDETYWRCASVLEPIAGRAVLIAFDSGFLLAARQHGWPRLGGVVAHWHEREQPALIAAAPEFLFADVEHLPASGTLAWQAARLVVYEVADAALALDLAARGVDLVETFAVGELRAALARANHNCQVSPAGTTQ